jgi:hypothetical protein
MAMGTARIPDPTESVRHQLRPLFDQVVINEERLLVCRVTQLLGVLESASLDR